MKQNKFDLIMDYIDESLVKDDDSIKRGILELLGIPSNIFGNYFTIITGDTLGAYIRKRRLYYAAKDLSKYPNRPIVDIALDYGYSDQSSFTRAFSSTYGFSPGKLRNPQCTYSIPNEKYHFDDFNEDAMDSRSIRIWREFERTGYISQPNREFLQCVHEAHEDYGYDIDTCYAIADLAERLEVPPSALMRVCFDLVEDFHSDANQLREADLVAVHLGIRSDKDLQEICDHYACKYYELNSFMVEQYYSTRP